MQSIKHDMLAQHTAIIITPVCASHHFITHESEKNTILLWTDHIIMSKASINYQYNNNYN